ncbi:MAG TPA: D-alanyl-D-alanine carboxypeptidase/D-alanyl-D-alanine-endopeptidase [Nannocystaceae bacterium]|nr:D-alanyl-D-alanine carboxypeptidase/D-alanyl-D-alanine-endopeptidase [Nannocystaceae bacterium]
MRSRAVAHASAAAPVDPALADELAAIAAAAGPRTQVGITVRALDTGATLFDRRGDAALNPASNHKLLTAIAALELLGADYRFTTRVLRDGDTLVVAGEGDPALQTEDLRALARTIAATPNLPTIRRIVVDDTAFSDERFGPGYDASGPGYSYMAPSGALSLQWNTIAITATATHTGAPLEVAIDPPCAHVEVVVDAITGRGAPLAIETSTHGERTRVVVRGTLSRREGTARIRRRIADPGLFAGSVLARALALHGLPEPEVVRGATPSRATLLAEHVSPPLRDVLHSALKYSNNFTTEQILRTLGHRLTGEPGDWHNGSEALMQFWSALGRDPDELVFENAAGYSRRGRASARALVDLLQFALDDDSEARSILAALAVSGRDGTLRDRLHDAAGRVLAKTGSLAGTSALTGVILDEAGTPRVGFSILLNGAVDRKSGARLQDRLVRALIGHTTHPRVPA